MTDGKITKKKALMRLEEVLDTYGADPARWPKSERAALESLARTDSEGRRLFGEARALGRVMDSAPSLSASNALKANIVAAAVNDPDGKARIVPIPPASERRVQRMQARRVAALWPAAALAASFALGLYLGVTGVGGSAFDNAFHVAATNGGAGDADSVSWLEDGTDSNGDDLL